MRSLIRNEYGNLSSHRVGIDKRELSKIRLKVERTDLPFDHNSIGGITSPFS